MGMKHWHKIGLNDDGDEGGNYRKILNNARVENEEEGKTKS